MIKLTSRLRSLLKGKSKKSLRPNIVIILLDQFRSDALDTHRIFSKLKKEAVFFPQTITYAPYTLASCHATFTGMYGRDNGVDAYTKSNHFKKKECFTLTQYLKSEGYYTRGYTFSSILIPHSDFDSLTVVHEDDEPNILDSHKQELDRCFSQRKPFFSYLHHGEIHHDIVKNVIKQYSIDDEQYFGHFEKNKNRYQTYTHDAGIYLESLYKHINSLDTESNTIVIVMTDHGSSNGEKIGEKAYGTFVYDYTINIWHYWLWPKNFPQGLEISKQVRTIDILPTLLDLLDIREKKNKKVMGGVSLLPLINGKEDTVSKRLAFSETGGVDGAYPSPNSPNIRCVRDEGWKLIQNTTTNKFELYNLNDDSDEINNLYGIEIEKGDLLWENMMEFF
jgi:arylsulfatase A-like enzyme